MVFEIAQLENASAGNEHLVVTSSDATARMTPRTRTSCYAASRSFLETTSTEVPSVSRRAVRLLVTTLGASSIMAFPGSFLCLRCSIVRRLKHARRYNTNYG